MLRSRQLLFIQRRSPSSSSSSYYYHSTSANANAAATPSDSSTTAASRPVRPPTKASIPKATRTATTTTTKNHLKTNDRKPPPVVDPLVIPVRPVVRDRHHLHGLKDYRVHTEFHRTLLDQCRSQWSAAPSGVGVGVSKGEAKADAGQGDPRLLVVEEMAFALARNPSYSVEEKRRALHLAIQVMRGDKVDFKVRALDGTQQSKAFYPSTTTATPATPATTTSATKTPKKS